MPSSLSVSRRRQILVLCAIALVAVPILVTAVLLGGDRNRLAELPGARQPRPGPVLLIPGYGGSTIGLNVLASRLRKAGRQVQVLSLPGDGMGDLNVQAKALAAAATALVRGSQAGSIDVVGYSAGGVVARLWVQNYGGASLARRIVTLGSPQHGTDLASLGALVPFACPTACRQLAPDSALLAALNAEPLPSPGPSYVSIWTTGDDVVLPADSARLDGALNLTVQSVCSSAAVSHSELPTDPLVAAMVSAELAAGPPASLGAADCQRLSP